MRRRLALLAVATTSLVLIAFLVPLAVLVRTLAAERATAAATTWAQSVATAAALGDRDTLEATVRQAQGSGGVPITVFLPGHGFLGAAAPRGPGVELAARGRSITVDTPQGREILVAVQGGASGPTVVRAFVGADRLRQGVGWAWLVLGLIGLALLAVGIAVADRLARSLTGPVGQVAEVSRRLARGDLAARVDPAGPPEVREVGAALNHLAARIRELLAHEREAVADLSHRLRTPVAALRLEVDTMRDAEEAARVGQAVAGVERMVDQVIREARRFDRDGVRGCDAARVVAERVAFWSALAEDQERPLGLDLADGPIAVGVSGPELAACVDLLLENVFAHTPDGTPFTVTLTARPEGGARLVIADRGPGFPHPAPLGRGVSGGSSTGLGLDIARRTAEDSGGRLRAGSSPSGGAEVTLELGPGTA
ncbi:HAMP domain-containing histidine kinase [Planomonospora sp. ID91781]|uniref:Signal transduction histidine-protein kinase/phosphatase MprB n=2 Tax=Planomonospora parontospora TaxID=58119 RepID=A0AA37BJV5_9ACTN|nr:MULTISPECIES: HAMP domain-containing sensor histidine kinase [Planomonospora]MBG0822982.1 HAMP domain-containing histidine kinase [Planomonospora sp. ID91781]GGK82094.1 two-component sensor histidine kinase [Planomonospora parontospora]GII10984.1 two-component sensor histidine kinase [Planomonospora parontospora subsp. parontospora]